MYLKCLRVPRLVSTLLLDCEHRISAPALASVVDQCPPWTVSQFTTINKNHRNHGAIGPFHMAWNRCHAPKDILLYTGRMKTPYDYMGRGGGYGKILESPVSLMSVAQVLGKTWNDGPNWISSSKQLILKPEPYLVLHSLLDVIPPGWTPWKCYRTCVWHVMIFWIFLEAEDF